ncbi:lipoprotein 17-related variable surface protein [Treponema maltophilum]|uniref:lipoprotein 17-related variable surface protein n=1 Tax=Treponema maltophilum TaxID=51160 RepID=UPI003D94AA83
MKKKNTRRFILLCAFVLPLYALSLSGCRQPSASPAPGKKGAGSSFRKKPQINHAVPQNPYELVEADVLEAFGLTKGKQSPFEAAEKIDSGNSVLPSIVFTQKEVTAYDDEAGTFTVKVTGTKNGIQFEKEMTVSGFANPYASDPQSIYTADDKGALKLDEGIEHNHSIEKYTEKANANIAAFFKALLTVLLENGTSVTLGDFPGYTLTAALEKRGENKIKIVPVYTVKNHKKVGGGADTVTPTPHYSNFTRLSELLTKDYFTEKDVFEYVLSKTDNSVIKVYPNEFASSFYALAKQTGGSPEALFDDSRLEPYKTRYQTKDADEYMQLDITCGIHDPKNGGIDADDYKEELTVRFCIATQEQLANQGEITAVKTITRTSYAKITNAAELKNQLFFDMSSKPNPSAEAIKTWKKKQFDNVPLLRIGDDGAVVLAANPLPDGPDKPFCLCINGEATLSNHLGCAIYGASKTRNNKVIFIENIQLQKEANSKFMTVQVKLKGSGGILEVPAAPGY